MGSGKMDKDVWHHEALTLALRNAVLLRRWGMRITVYADPTPANNGDWVLSYNLSSTSKSDNSNWLKVADIGATWGGGGSTVNFGLATQIPFMNATNDNFSYSPSITWDEANHLLVAADDVTFTGTSSWSVVFGELHTIGGIFNDGLITGEGHSTEGIAGNNVITGRNHVLSGTGTKNFNFVTGDANTIVGFTNALGNFISGRNNQLSETQDSAIIGGNGITGTESNTVYTPSLNFSGNLTGNVIEDSAITVQPAVSFVISDSPGTAYFVLQETDVQIGNTNDLLQFTEGSPTVFTAANNTGGLRYGNNYRGSYVDRSLVDWGNVLSAKTYAGKQTMFATAANAGLNLGVVGSDPTTLTNGDIWYNSALNTIRGRVNGNNISIFPAISNTSASNEIPYTVSTFSFASSGVFRQSGALTGLVFGSITDSNIKALTTDAPGSSSDLHIFPKGFAGGLSNVIFGNPTGAYPRVILGSNQLFAQQNVQADFTIVTQNIVTGGASGSLVLRTSSVSNSQPGNVNVIGGSALVGGNFNGGNVNITSGNGIGTGTHGNITMTVPTGGKIIMTGLPTSSAGLVTGELWNNAGVLSIIP